MRFLCSLRALLQRLRERLTSSPRFPPLVLLSSFVCFLLAAWLAAETVCLALTHERIDVWISGYRICCPGRGIWVLEQWQLEAILAAVFGIVYLLVGIYALRSWRRLRQTPRKPTP